MQLCQTHAGRQMLATDIKIIKTFVISSAASKSGECFLLWPVEELIVILGFLDNVRSKVLTCYLYCCYCQAMLETTIIIKVPHNKYNAQPCCRRFYCKRNATTFTEERVKI